MFRGDMVIAPRRGHTSETDAIGSLLINPMGCTFPGTASESLTRKIGVGLARYTNKLLCHCFRFGK